MDVKIIKKIEKDIVIISITGRFDYDNAPLVISEVNLDSHLDKGYENYIFDFTKLDYISSSGLRAILLWSKKIRRVYNKRLVVVITEEAVEEIIELSGFNALLHIVHNMDDARNFFVK